MPFRLRILHISDLHERVALDWMTDERKRTVRVRAASRYRVLDGSNYLELIAQLGREGPFDLVCFTGDIADWGLQEEYVEATRRIDRILKAAGAKRDQLYVVPGNHDIARKQHKDSWEKLRDFAGRYPLPVGGWLAGLPMPPGADPVWLDSIGARHGAFWRWVEKDIERPALLPKCSPHGRLGYHVSLRLPDFPFGVHVVGLDTAWLAGDEHDARKLRLTQEQITMLARDERGAPLEGFRVALMHHPLGDLADERTSIMQLSETVDLLLHGHQHDPVSETRVDPDRALRVLAAGSLYEGDEGDRWLNSFHTIDVDLDEHGRPRRYEVRFFGWSPNGHWHATGAIYKSAPNGVLAIELGGAAVLNVAPPEPVWYLVERQQTFDRFREKLLGGKQSALALVGMSGVGKSTMARVAARDPQVMKAFPGGILWITLGQERVTILQQIRATLLACADTGEPPADIDVGWRRLAEALRERAALLVLDDVWLATDVAAFQLTGRSKVLITTRDWAVADAAGAPKFELEPLTEDEALTLIERRLDRSMSGDERLEAVKVADAVGRLPLALIAICTRIEEGDSWQSVRKEVDDEVKRLSALDVPSGVSLGVAAAFELSIRTLSVGDAEGFALLSLFAEDTVFAPEATANLWNVTPEQALARCRRLRRTGLTMQKAAADGRRLYQLHDQQRDAGRRMLKLSPQDAHKKLLAQYRRVTSPLSRVADDGYIHDHLIWHVIQSGELDELQRVLADERDGRNVWFEARNRRLGGYVDDLQLALEAVRGSWGLELRYAQMLGSVASQSSKVPGPLFETLLVRGLWSIERAFGHSIALPSFERVSALCMLLPKLTGPLRQRAVDTVLADIAAAEGRRRIWMLQLPCVFVADEPDRLLALAKQVTEDRPRAIAATLRHFVATGRSAVAFDELHALAQEKDLGTDYGLPVTVAGLIREMHVLSSMGLEDVRRVLALYGADSWLRVVASSRLGELGELREALGIAIGLPEAERGSAMRSLAPRLQADQIAEGIAAVLEIKDEGSRVEALTELYARLDEPQRTSKMIELYRSAGRWGRFVTPHLPAHILSTMWLPEDTDGRKRVVRRLAQLGLAQRALQLLGKPGRQMNEELEILAPLLSEADIVALGIHEPDTDPYVIGALLSRWIELGHGAELSGLLRKVSAETYALECCMSALVPKLDDAGVLATLAVCTTIGDAPQRQRCTLMLATLAPRSLAGDLFAMPPELHLEHEQLHQLARTLPSDIALQLRARSSSPLHRLAISSSLETWSADEILQDMADALRYMDERLEQISDLPLNDWAGEQHRMRAVMDYYVRALALAPSEARAEVEITGRLALKHFGLGAPQACVAFFPPDTVVGAAGITGPDLVSSLATIAALLQGSYRAEVETLLSPMLQKMSPYQVVESLGGALELSPALLDIAFENFLALDDEIGASGVELVSLLARANRMSDAVAVLARIPQRYEDSRMRAHVQLALHAPVATRLTYLEKVWDQVLQLKYANSDQGGAGFIEKLMPVVLTQPRDVKESFARRALTSLTRTTRPQLYAYLAALAPLMRELGGEGSLVECRNAVSDVGRWWP